MNYNDKLRESAKATGNIVCMGLDPVWEAMPLEVKKKSDGNFKRANQIFFDKIFDEMNKRNIFPSAYKPNQGFYEEHDTPLEGNFEGSQALGSLMNSLNSNFSGTPVILDSKRGDIGKSSANYARSNLERWNADACTVSPYMGTDSVMPFGLEGKGVWS